MLFCQMSRNIIPQHYILLFLIKNDKILVTRKEKTGPFTWNLMSQGQPHKSSLCHKYILDTLISNEFFSNIEALNMTSALQTPIIEFEFWHTIYYVHSHEEKICLWIYKIKSMFLMKTVSLMSYARCSPLLRNIHKSKLFIQEKYSQP